MNPNGTQASTTMRLRFIIVAILLTALIVTVLSPTSEAQQDNSKAKAESAKTSKAKSGKPKAKTKKSKAKAEEAKTEEKTSAEEAKVEETSGESMKVSRSEAKVAESGDAKAVVSDGCARAKVGNVVAESGCGDNNGGGNAPGPAPDPAPDPAPNPDPNPAPSTLPETTGPVDGSEDNPLPADDAVGPLEGAQAIGEDIDVAGDIIGQDPDTGDDVVGIDTITIKTENCEITDPDNLSVTLSILDGGPGRFIDGPDGDDLDNAEITVDEDQVVIRGQGPGNVVEPFFVEGQGQAGGIFVQDTFDVISSTGIGGEGCRAIQATENTNENTNTDTNPTTNDTTNDTGNDAVNQIDWDKPLPDTGGERNVSSTRELTLLTFAVLLGLTGWRIAVRARR